MAIPIHGKSGEDSEKLFRSIMNSEDQFQIRIETPQSKDIPNLIECVRRCYGDSYPNKAMYDPEHIKVAIESKIMHSVVALDQNDRVIGHCALTFNSPQNAAPEAGKMFVDPDYRGHHIAESIAQKRLEIAKDLDLLGFWTECVTNHPYSQREMIHFGAKETGLTLGMDDASAMVMQGLESHNRSRMSLLTFYLPLRSKSQKIFLPESHLSFAQDLARTIEIDRVVTSSDKSGEGLTQASFRVDHFDKIAFITINHIGNDLLAFIENTLIQLGSGQLASIYLDLPIHQEAAAFAYDALEKKGFFWSAWLPNYLVEGDVLRLQRLNQAINFDDIVTARPEGEKIKKYIQTQLQKVSTKSIRD
jgi:GNAT superfamily N-acetyltransferase